MKRGLIEQRSISSDDPFLPEYFELLKNDPYSGVTANSPDLAMKISAVYRSVSILSGTIASLPLNIRKKAQAGHFEVDENDPLYSLLRWRASNRSTIYELLENAIIQILMQGNALIYPKFKDTNYSELVLITPGMWVYDKYTDKYTITDMVNGIKGTFDSWRVIHLRNKNLDGSKMGISTIQYAGRILNISANADEQTLANMKTGNKQKGFLTGGSVMDGMGKLQDSQVDVVKQRLEDELTRGDAIMRLPGELKFQALSISPADAQILDNRKFSVFDVCRFFGVHPDKVFVEQTSNYKASENSQTSFMTDTLQPMLSQIETEFTVKLIARSLAGKQQKIQFDREYIYSLDPKTVASYYKDMFDVGGLTTNEIRVRQNMPPVEGGDVAFVTANVAPITSAKIYGEPQSKSKDEPAEKQDKKTTPTDKKSV